MTSHRIMDIPTTQTPPPRAYHSSTPESFARAQGQALRRKLLEHEEQVKRDQLIHATRPVDPTLIPCPPSPEYELYAEQPPCAL